MMGIRTQDQVVALPALREVFSRVINDMVCANRLRRVHIPCAAHGSDFSSERFGNLDRKCTYTTRRAINQNLVALLDASLITETLQRSDCRDWYGCGVLKRTVGWLQRQLVFTSTRILGKPSPCETGYPEHLVAWLKLLYLSAHGFHSPCDITAEDLLFWCAQPRDQADYRRTSHGEQVQWIYRRRVKRYQDLIGRGRRFCYLRELQHTRWSVSRAYNRFHNVSSRLLPSDRDGFIAPWFRWLALQSRRNESANSGGISRVLRASSAPSARPCAGLFAAEHWSVDCHDYPSLRTESGREPAVRQPARRQFEAIRTASAAASSRDA